MDTVNQIQTFIENNGDDLFSELINILLVSYGVRTATIVELFSESKDTIRDVIFRYLVFFHNLYIAEDDNYIYISNSPFTIPENSYQLGKFLGFSCYKFHNWSSLEIPRLAVHIYMDNYQ